jgi:uncharacterized protein (DUF433 family)
MMIGRRPQVVIAIEVVMCRGLAAGIEAVLVARVVVARVKSIWLSPRLSRDTIECMAAIERITVNGEVCGGRPCIRGLRVRVKDILDLLAAGATREEILIDYPYLEADDITAVLEFAAKQNDHPVLRSA